MATDFKNLTRRANEARGTSLENAFFKPERKIFTPNISPESPEAKAYANKYGIPPHDLGDQIKQHLLERQKSGLPYGETYYRPTAEFGAQGFHPSRILEIPNNWGAAYIPPGGGFPADVATRNLESYGKHEVEIYETVNILGESQRLIDDFIIINEKSNPNSVKHELIHRAFMKMLSKDPHTYSERLPHKGKFKEVKFYNKDSSRTRTVKFTEEDVVKLLDFVSGDRVELATKYFGNGKEPGFGRQWNNESIMNGVITSAEELLQSPEILKLLTSIQQFAAEELKKQGKDIPFNFGSIGGKPRVQFAPIPELFTDVLK